MSLIINYVLLQWSLIYDIHLSTTFLDLKHSRKCKTSFHLFWMAVCFLIFPSSESALSSSEFAFSASDFGSNFLSWEITLSIIWFCKLPYSMRSLTTTRDPTISWRYQTDVLKRLNRTNIPCYKFWSINNFVSLLIAHTMESGCHQRGPTAFSSFISTTITFLIYIGFSFLDKSFY